MSGIYGVYRYDGAPVDPRWLERMKTAMAFYGFHGGGSRIEGPVGMGHLLLEINPEDALFFQCDLSLLMDLEGQAMTILHLSPIQFEVCRGTLAGKVIPAIGQQDTSNIQK